MRETEAPEAVSLAWRISSEQLATLPKAKWKAKTWALQFGRIWARRSASGAFVSSSAVGGLTNFLSVLVPGGQGTVALLLGSPHSCGSSPLSVLIFKQHKSLSAFIKLSLK